MGFGWAWAWRWLRTSRDIVADCGGEKVVEAGRICGVGVKGTVRRREKLKRGTFVALDRQNPPFAKCAKDGAPSSSDCQRRWDGRGVR